MTFRRKDDDMNTNLNDELHQFNHRLGQLDQRIKDMEQSNINTQAQLDRIE
jgi:hypothetical protein